MHFTESCAHKLRTGKSNNNEKIVLEYTYNSLHVLHSSRTPHSIKSKERKKNRKFILFDGEKELWGLMEKSRYWPLFTSRMKKFKSKGKKKRKKKRHRTCSRVRVVLHEFERKTGEKKKRSLKTRNFQWKLRYVMYFKFSYVFPLHVAVVGVEHISLAFNYVFFFSLLRNCFCMI